MLRSLKLSNFRAFGDFVIHFSDGAYLVGPNNAGKSTILTALRTADTALRQAHQRGATLRAIDDRKTVVAYPTILRDYPSLQESVRHEFRNLEARLLLIWKSGARLSMVWPSENEDAEQVPFFYLESPDGLYVTGVSAARAHFPLLGVIPILTPVESKEASLEDKYVRQNVAGRLSSRHFRNHLRLLQQEGSLAGFLEWSQEWLDDIKIEGVTNHLGDKSLELDIYYSEAGGRTEKELAWAGDGIQIWLQLLYHLWRTRDRSTAILDEPEVYLHPDLQRRLVRLLQSTGRQVILATHSAELLSEIDARAISVVDKTARTARRVKSDTDLQALSDTLGTSFNVRLAKALRTRAVLFVEGNDMAVLRQFATILGLGNLANERNITIVKLEGYSHWGQVEPFRWLLGELLPNAIRAAIILDRDYRPSTVINPVLSSLGKEGILGHVWERKELESYVLTPEVIARVTGLSIAVINGYLLDAAGGLENEVFGKLLGERVTAGRSIGIDASTITTKFKAEFDSNWQKDGYRLDICPPKQLISEINRRLQMQKKPALTAASLARAHSVEEVPEEVAGILRRIEELT